MKYYILVNDIGEYLHEDRGLSWTTSDFRKASLFNDILKVKELRNRFPVFKVMEVEIVLRDVSLVF